MTNARQKPPCWFLFSSIRKLNRHQTPLGPPILSSISLECAMPGTKKGERTKPLDVALPRPRQRSMLSTWNGTFALMLEPQWVRGVTINTFLLIPPKPSKQSPLKEDGLGEVPYGTTTANTGSRLRLTYCSIQFGHAVNVTPHLPFFLIHLKSRALTSYFCGKKKKKKKNRGWSGVLGPCHSARKLYVRTA